VAGLRAEIAALEAAVAAESITALRGLPDLGTLTRAQAVEVLLRNAERPLGPRDMVTAFGRNGRPDESITNLTSVLGQLARRGKVQRVARGLYVLMSESSG